MSDLFDPNYVRSEFSSANHQKNVLDEAVDDITLYNAGKYGVAPFIKALFNPDRFWPFVLSWLVFIVIGIPCIVVFFHALATGR